MVLEVVLNPNQEQIDTLRRQFYEKLKKDGCPFPDGFHPNDMARIEHGDAWLIKFLQHNDLDLKVSLNMLWSTCIWRKEFKVNEITADNIRKDYRDLGLYYSQGRDIDGKILFMFRCKKYTRGNYDTDELKRVLLYWFERTIREENEDLVSAVFDLTECGLSNIDIEYTSYIISVFKNYYPRQINYIIVYDMAWILNATFQIIKRLLPAKAVARLKLLKAKNVTEFIPIESIPTSWPGTNGLNNYQYKYAPEKIQQNGELKNGSQAVKKVHFANISPPDSPTTTMTLDNKPGKDLGGDQLIRVSPNDAITFELNGKEVSGNVQITNVDPKKPVTFKIKTTAPEKFRVRPSTGYLRVGESLTINVVFNQSQQLQVGTLTRDKFLVMTMALDEDDLLKPAALPDLWKNTASSSAQVEQHRLKCCVPPNLEESMAVKNGALLESSFISDKNNSSSSQLQQTLQCLTETTHRLESQMRFTQALQWITIVAFLVLSVAILYILKVEIKSNGAGDYCVKPGLKH